jgi:hypothetical protein
MPPLRAAFGLTLIKIGGIAIRMFCARRRHVGETAQAISSSRPALAVRIYRTRMLCGDLRAR